jgi:hypothetical protein
MLSGIRVIVTFFRDSYAECCYAQCRCAECRYAVCRRVDKISLHQSHQLPGGETHLLRNKKTGNTC